jgi:TRAP-type C4-dicarboxylate transport system permease small subunit
MYRGLCKLNDIICNVLKAIVICLLITMSVFVFMQVVYRYILKQPIAWSEELTTYLFSWLAYLGAVIALKNNKHVRVNSFIEKIANEQTRKKVIIFSQFLMLVFLITTAYFSAGLAGQILANDQRLVTIPSFKLGYIFMQVPISCAAMSLIMIEKIIATVNPNVKISSQQLKSVEGGTK